MVAWDSDQYTHKHPKTLRTYIAIHPRLFPRLTRLHSSILLPCLALRLILGMMMTTSIFVTSVEILAVKYAMGVLAVRMSSYQKRKRVGLLCLTGTMNRLED